MNFEDIGRVWREQGTGDFQRRKIENLSMVQGRAERFLDRHYRKGIFLFVITFLGLAAAVAVAAVADAGRPWLAWPGLIILIATLLRGLFSWQGLRRPRIDATPPVRHAVQAAVDRLVFMERFWERAGTLRFYLPFLTGEILAFEGFRPVGEERGIVSAGFYSLLFFIVVYGSFNNRRAARQTVRPLREELESWLADLAAFEHDSSPDAEPKAGTP
jgi:hypothetical protein